MTDLERKSAIALGVCLICLMAIGETAVAHRLHPNPASPLVWGVLGTVAAVSLALWARWRSAARRAGGRG